MGSRTRRSATSLEEQASSTGMLPSSSSGSLQASSSGSLPAPAAAFMAGQSHPVEIPVSSHGGSAPLLSDADHTRLSDAGITPDLYPELLDSDMHDLGLSLPSIIALRRTRTAVSAPAPAAARAPTPSSSTAPKPVIPTFRGRESSSYQDADEFLIRFEIAVRCAGHPMATWNLILLNQLSQFVDLQFWQENAMGLDWESAKDLFIGHFRHPNAIQMRIDELTRIRQKPSESIREYLDRFASLVRLSNQPDDSPLLVSYFRRGLHSAEVRKSLELREDIRNPYSTFKEISEAALFCEAQVQRRNLDDPGSGTTKHFKHKCSYHGENSTHPTKDCRMLKPQPDTSSFHPSKKPASSSSSTTHATPAAAPRTPCWKCKQMGHWANDCPNKTVTFDASKPSLPKPTGSSTPASSFGIIYPMVHEPPPAKKAPASLNEREHFPEVTVAVEIAGSTLQALIDTGAGKSYIRKAVTQTLDLSICPSTAKIRLGDGSVVPVLESTDEVTIRSNGHSLRLRMGILVDIQHDLILGRDVIFQLGIGLTGLPDPTQHGTTIENDDNMVVTADPPLSRVSAADVARITQGIAHGVSDNASIPAESFCTHPGSQVEILTENQKPVFRRQYPIPRALQEAVTDQIQRWLHTNRIRRADPSTQWNLPLTVAPKKDLLGHKTAVRVCMDTRSLNEILPDDNYPIPRISDLFEKISGFAVASSLDLRESYTQLYVKDSDQDKLTFTWASVRYCWQGAPYGLKFLTAHFQRVMTSILNDCLPFVIIFVDDVVVFSNSISEHIEHLHQVLRALNAVSLRLNLDKCHFGFTQLPILGHIISGDQIKADPSKIAAFHTIPIPRTGKQVESFLGMANYLRDYIPLYAKIAAPLEKLRKVKHIGPEWTPACQQAFDQLKLVLSKAPVLTQANPDHPLLIATDASQFGVGAVLYQVIHGKNHYVAFASKALNPAQVNYPATRRELLAVIFAVSKFRNWIYGQRFTLFCDHSAITFLFTGSHESKMLNYWAFTLLEYNFTIVHRPGVLNILPDALSRLYGPPLGEKEAAHLQQLNVIDLDTRVAHAPQQLAEFVKHRFDKDTPETEEAKSALLQRLHQMSHLGADALFRQVWNEGYFWPSLLKDCKATASQCKPCQQFNIVRQGFHPLNPIHAELPFDHLAIDLAGPFPTSTNGHNFLFVITDIATRFTLLRPITDKTAATIALHLYQIFTDFGFPRIIQSDNGTEFVNATMHELKANFGFDHRTISPYHPQANGAAESHVKIAKQLLSKLCNGQWNHWDLFVPATQYGMNLRTTKRHGSTPFSLMLARAPNPFKSYQADTSRPLTTEQLVKRIDFMNTIVYPAIADKTATSSARVVRMFSKDHKILDDGFPAGSHVMMNTEPRTSKLHPKYEGPFTVLRRTKGGAYTLLDATGQLLPKTVSPDKLKLISLPESSSSEPSYEVHQILNHRGSPTNREYLVRWKGYGPNSDSWEPAANFDSPLLIQQYFDRINAGGK